MNCRDFGFNGAELGNSTLDVLIAVEDPGAANYVLELPEVFAKAGLSSCIFACGHAQAFLRERKVAFEELPEAINPEEILNKCAPKLLLAGTSQNPKSPVLQLIDEFRRQGLPAVAFLDMAADADRRFKGVSDDPLKHAPDRILVADRSTESAFQNMGFPADRIHICGHPAYERVRRQAQALEGVSRSSLRDRVLGTEPFPRPVWVFAAEHDGGDRRLSRAADYTLKGRETSDRRVEIVLEEVLDARQVLDPKPYLVLRLHPKNSRDEFSRYLQEIDLLSHGGDPLELICASDLVIGLSSMFLMEAAVAGRKTLSVVPRASECDWAPSVVDGLTPCVSTRKDLLGMLKSKEPVTSKVAESDSASRILSVIRSQFRIIH